ncbi:TPA: SIR2 family protein [Campylobacter coli]|nr:SIR2 family protein [Campylobacter coli]
MSNQTDNKFQTTIHCFQGAEDLSSNKDNKDNKDKIKAVLFDLFNIKNVNFLFGAGASNRAIPTMKELQKCVVEKLSEDEKKIFDEIKDKNLEEILEILYSGKTYLKNNPQDKDKDNREFNTLKSLIEKIENAIFQRNNLKNSLSEDEKKIFEEVKERNLEEILEILYSGKTYLKNNPQDKDKDNREFNTLKSLIEKIEEIIFKKINIEIGINCGSNVQKEVFENYMKFYKKVTYRNKDLNRVNIFTTNNDLFNEYVLDYLNIDYNNGFGGGLKRSFNPARFEYVFAKKMDEGIEKYEPLNHMIYLYKLHGSINWVETKNHNSFFDIEEIYLKSGEQKPKETCLIYPTPLKEGKSLTSPYTDLIREFQKKLSLPNSVLFIIGYSFSDEHINTIIYRALASNNSLSVVIFADKDKLARKIPLFSINDKRIYVIYGKDEDKTIHHFKYFVDELIPEQKQNEEDEIYKKFASIVKNVTGDKNDCG